MAKKRIILVEDEKDMAEVVALRLQREGYAVTVVHDGRCAELPVIMMTAKSDASDVVVGLKMGADDYVTKPFSMSVLLARVSAVLRRAQRPGGAGAAVLKAGPLRIDQDRHRVAIDGEPVALTLTEFRLLAALVAGRGRVLSRNQLIDQAMGMDAVVTDRTVDVHLTALRRKLGKARDLIRTVRGVGYKLATDDDEAP